MDEVGLPYFVLRYKERGSNCTDFPSPPYRSFLQGWGGESSAHLAFGEFSSHVYGSCTFVILYFDLVIIPTRKNLLLLLSQGFQKPVVYSQTSLIRTPKGQNQVSALQRCPYYRGRECRIFGISGTKRTVRNREVSVL